MSFTFRLHTRQAILRDRDSLVKLEFNRLFEMEEL